MKPSFAFLTLAAVALCFPGPAHADINIGASPAFLDLELEPGKTSAQTILLFNSGKDPVTVNAYAWDWWHEPGNGRKFGPPGTLPHSASRWVSFTPKEITVLPQKAVNITVVVATPADAQAGNYAVAWFEAIPEGSKDSKELRLGARLGVLVMTAIKGRTKPQITVDAMKIAPPTASKPLKVDFTLVNSGDVHLFPKGTLVLMNAERKLMGHLGFEKRRLLPQEKSEVTLKWAGELAPGEYQTVLTVDFGEAGATVKTQSFTVPGAKGS